MNGDLINGLFESIGAVCIWSNVHRLWKDRQVKGTNWWTALFFWAWGLWNLWYYPSLDQWLSFWGGAALQLGNFAWLGMLLWVTWQRGRKCKRVCLCGLCRPSFTVDSKGRARADFTDELSFYSIGDDIR